MSGTDEQEAGDTGSACLDRQCANRGAAIVLTVLFMCKDARVDTQLSHCIAAHVLCAVAQRSDTPVCGPLLFYSGTFSAWLLARRHWLCPRRCMQTMDALGA